jgi:hypothetical protein
MKKFYMTMVALLCGVAAMAQTCTISVADPVEIVADGELYYFDVVLNESEPGTLVTGASFTFELPKGVLFRYYDAGDEDWYMNITYPNAKNAFKTMCDPISDDPDNNTFQVASAASGSTYFKTSTNVLAKIGIKVVDPTAAAAESEIKFTKISFARPDPNGGVAAESCYPQDDFSVTLKVAGGTGINSVNADNENAPIYNLAGQRVSKAQKGIFIQNGKKSIK